MFSIYAKHEFRVEVDGMQSNQAHYINALEVHWIKLQLSNTNPNRLSAIGNLVKDAVSPSFSEICLI